LRAPLYAAAAVAFVALAAAGGSLGLLLGVSAGSTALAAYSLVDRYLSHDTAALAGPLGYANALGALCGIGAVVGATHPRAVADARRLMPRTILLLPGVGAQGGSVADLGRAFQSGPASALVAASRSVIYAYRESGADFREAAGAEASRLQREVWAASGW
jgi:orotidine-5'-phosphate decarboxylase